MTNEFSYLTGFGNQLATEVEPGVLPQGQNNPLQVKTGLYAEQLSGTAFTMRRSENFRTWLYRKKPSVTTPSLLPYARCERWVSQQKDKSFTPPQALRWMQLPEAKEGTTFVEGISTMVANASASGTAVSHYVFNDSTTKQALMNSDGELLLIPQEGKLLILSEMGRLTVKPLEIAIIPRGVKFSVTALDGKSTCRGYMAENLGEPLRLPELGPIGANGLANARDFYYPEAWCDQGNEAWQLVVKFQHNFWQTDCDHSPFDVLAWHGNYAPCKYDLTKFNTMGSISFDHPDPSIFTVLTSPSSTAGKANMDFVIFPPRWLVADHTFRPPYYHRNLMNEYMGLIQGQYDAKEEGFVPGGSSLHNCMVPHGPDKTTYEKELKRTAEPQKLESTMAFMCESSEVYQLTEFAAKVAPQDLSYQTCWTGL